MSDNKWPVMLLFGFLIAASTTAAFVSKRKHVMESCRDLRIAMDGSYSAVVESGGLTPSIELTIYQEHNRKRIKLDRVEVEYKQEGDEKGKEIYYNDHLKLVVTDKTQSSTGRNIASLQGEVRGEKVSATLSCAN
jgi:hypothetical protein